MGPVSFRLYSCPSGKSDDDVTAEEGKAFMDTESSSFSIECSLGSRIKLNDIVSTTRKVNHRKVSHSMNDHEKTHTLSENQCKFCSHFQCRI